MSDRRHNSRHTNLGKIPGQGACYCYCLFALFFLGVITWTKGMPSARPEKRPGADERGRVRVRGAGNFERDTEGRARPHKGITIFLAVSRGGSPRQRYGWTLRGWGGYDYGFLFFAPTIPTKLPTSLYMGPVGTARGIIRHVFNTATTQLSSSLVPCQFSPPRNREYPLPSSFPYMDGLL